jgi:Holliday junction resolvase RusA-like endonuclease
LNAGLAGVVFTVPGEPQGKGRARVGKVGGHARLFTPPKTVAYEGLIAHAGAAAMAGQPPLQGPLSLELVAVSLPPQSWSKRKRSDAFAGLIRPTGKPDADNVAKAVGDGGNGVLWADDKQIVDLRVQKVYGPRAELQVLVSQWARAPLLEGLA